MNRLRYFDRYQYLIVIVAIASLAVSMIFLVVMLFTATPVYAEETGELIDLKYNSIIQIIYSSIVLIHLTASAWFIARTITYKMRCKEEETL